MMVRCICGESHGISNIQQKPGGTVTNLAPKRAEDVKADSAEIQEGKLVSSYLTVSHGGSPVIIIIIIYCENVHFFHTKVGLDICPYEVPPHISEYYCTFRLQTNHFHVILHTFSPNLPIPPLHLTHATFTFLQADTLSSTLLCFRCPNPVSLLFVFISINKEQTNVVHLGVFRIGLDGTVECVEGWQEVRSFYVARSDLVINFSDLKETFLLFFLNKHFICS